MLIERLTMDSINSPDMACGMAMRWFLHEHPKKYEHLYNKIVDKTLGYLNKYSYIKQSEFDLTPKHLKIHRDWLVENKIIKWRKTDGFTQYEILEPSDVIEKCNFKIKVEEQEQVFNGTSLVDSLL